MQRIVSIFVFVIFVGSALPVSGAAAGTIPATVAGVYEVTPQPAPNGCLPPGPAAANIVTFRKDGTLVNVDPFLGTAVGEISKGPGGTYYSTFFGTTYSPVVGGILRYEVSGTSSVGTEEQFEGTYVTTLTFPDGATCTFEGTFTGQRLVPSAN